jgi:hypothetical protein
MRYRIRTLMIGLLFGRSGPAIWGFHPPRYSLLTLLILMAVVPPYIALQWHRHIQHQKFPKQFEQKSRGYRPNAAIAAERSN